MSEPYTVRAFEDTTLDRAGLVDVVSAAFVHDRWVQDPDLDAARLRPMFADGALAAAERSTDQPATHFCFLALHQDTIVGAVLGYVEGRILEFTETRIGTIWSLAVAEPHRRKGVGTLLFQAAREWMEVRECVQLNVSTDAGNDANALYERLGCQRVHELVTWRLPLDVAEDGGE